MRNLLFLVALVVACSYPPPAMAQSADGGTDDAGVCSCVCSCPPAAPSVQTVTAGGSGPIGLFGPRYLASPGMPLASMPVTVHYSTRAEVLSNLHVRLGTTLPMGFASCFLQTSTAGGMWQTNMLSCTPMGAFCLNEWATMAIPADTEVSIGCVSSAMTGGDVTAAFDVGP